MKRILLLANEYTTIVDFRLELIRELVKKGYRVFVAVPWDKKCYKIKDSGAKVINVRMSRKGTNPIQDLITMLDIRRILNQVSPDIVLTYTIKPNVYGGIVCGLMRIPYLANITGLGTAVEGSGLTCIIAKTLYKLGLKKAQIVFFQNKANLLFMKKNKVVNCRTRLIPGSGVNLERFQLLAYPNDDTINFMFISRVMREKGIEEYVRAAKEVRKRYSNVSFHVCGFCEQGYEKLMEKCTKENVLLYHGQVDDIERMQQISQCTIHPSFYPEGLSNVLLESAASGRPVITTNRPGCKETVEDGVTGFLIKEKDPVDLTDKIIKFIELPWEERKKMGINGRKKIECEFDRRLVIQAYIEEIVRILSERDKG